MSQRSMLTCKDCESVFVITIITTKEEKVPTFCPICASDSVEKIESND